jgi:hypothetical protein
MNKWHLRFLRLAYFGLAAILPIYALADYNATQGAGTIFRAFDSTHGGTSLCAAANTQCQGIVNTNSAGAEVGIAAAPLRIDPTGTTTQPVSGTVAATQSGAWTVNPTTAANWGIGTSTYNSALVANGQLMLGQFLTSPGTLTTTNMAPLQVDSTGNLRVNVVAGGAGGGAVTVANGADVVEGNNTDAASCASGTSVVSCLRQVNASINSAIPAGTAHIGTIGVAPYADGAIPLTATATGTTAATTATLAASGSGLKTYICGFSIRANATAAVTNNATLTGVVTATMNFTQWTAPLASGLGVTEMVFSPCIPSSATNTAINVVSGAPGSGGVVSVSAWGYQL